MKLRKELGFVALVVLAIVSGLMVSGLLTTSKTLSSSGTLKSLNVEVFWDEACTQVVTSIVWGTPGPGDFVNRSIFLRNSGNAPLNLSLTANNWSPGEASNYLVIIWNREGVQMDSGDVLEAVLSLAVSGEITGITDFFFNIIIEGSG